MNRSEIALAAVSKVCRLKVAAILSPSRKWPLVEARQIVATILYSEGYTDATIADVLHRKRATALKIRHTALVTAEYSKAFNEKLSKARHLYESEKSIRIS